MRAKLRLWLRDHNNQLWLLIAVLSIALVGEIKWIAARSSAMSFEGRMNGFYDGQLQAMKDEVKNSCGRVPTGFIHVGELIIYNDQEYRCAVDYDGKMKLFITPLAMLTPTKQSHQ